MLHMLSIIYTKGIEIVGHNVQKSNFYFTFRTFQIFQLFLFYIGFAFFVLKNNFARLCHIIEIPNFCICCSTKKKEKARDNIFKYRIMNHNIYKNI